jgi:hypothetical protein
LPLAVPLVQRASRAVDAQVASFTGGLAAAYVFLHIFAELNQAHLVIGDRIYLLILAGFIAFYAIENHITHVTPNGESASRHSYVLRLTFQALYSVLLVFTLGEQLPENHLLSAMFAVTLGLHVMATDIGMVKRFGKQFTRRGHFILAASLVTGLSLSLLLQPSEMLIDILSASLAGFIIFTVFHEEISQTRETKIRWFLGGTLSFTALHLIIGA